MVASIEERVAKLEEQVRELREELRRHKAGHGDNILGPGYGPGTDDTDPEDEGPIVERWKP